MDILSVLTYYHPHWTGLSVVARRLAEGMAARGHRVTVLCARHDPALPEQEIINGVAVRRARSVARISRTVVMPSFPGLLARLGAASDIVHLHTPMPEAALVAAMTSHRRPMLVTHHGDVVMPAGSVNAAIKRAMDASIGTAMRMADRVVVHSADYARHSTFLAPVHSKIVNIYPPVVLPRPQPAATAEWRQALGLPHRPVVGFAGRFVEEKGFDYLLQAIPLVRARVPDAAFVFAGDTDIAYERFFDRCRPLLDQQAGAITRLGLLRDPQAMANFYALCDVFVLPSRTDCFAIVQVEALLSGTPLVTSDIPGAREVVRVSGAGRLANARNPAALADGISTVLSRPTRYRPNPEVVRAIFDPKRSLDRYEALMQRLIEQRAASPGPHPAEG